MQLPTLQQFFRHQLARGLADCGLSEPQTVEYVSDVLARFAHPDNLYALRDDEGRPARHLVDMLARANEAGGTAEREIVRHIGEFALFMAGLFRARLRRRGELNYYLDQGSGAFARCASLEPARTRCAVYRRLHQRFVDVATTLDHLRSERWPLDTPAAEAERPIADRLATSFWRT